MIDRLEQWLGDVARPEACTDADSGRGSISGWGYGHGYGYGYGNGDGYGYGRGSVAGPGYRISSCCDEEGYGCGLAEGLTENG